MLLDGKKALMIEPLALLELVTVIRVLEEPMLSVIMADYEYLKCIPLLSRQLNVSLYIPDLVTILEIKINLKY